MEVGIDEVGPMTDKAVLVIIADSGEEMWIPKSVIKNMDDVEDRVQASGPCDFDTLIVKTWWAKKYGFVEDEE